MKFVALAITICLLVSCSDDSTPNSVADLGMDAALDMGMNADVPADSATDDMDQSDAGDMSEPDLSDLGLDLADMSNDMSVQAFGTITGTCGEIDMTELTDPNALFFDNAIDFEAEFMDPADRARLSAGGIAILEAGNAGGSSIYSELFAYEVLERCDMATLVKTETEIIYDTQGSITDLLVEIDGSKVGVSVTRSVTFPRDTPLTEQRATELLSDKLSDIIESSANVSAEDAWVKQILHVIADRPEHVSILQTAWTNLDSAVRTDTIVFVTVTNGADEFVY